jgi:nucleotide-binding universal stress UspA family protein
MPIKIVLVPIRQSAACDGALRLAAEIAHSQGGRLLIVSLLRAETHGLSAYPTVLDDGLRFAQEADRLESQVTRVLGASTSRLSCELRIVVGKSHRRIAELAREAGADLIVIGASRIGIRRWIFGDLADRTARSAPCPVLLVTPPHGISTETPRTTALSPADRRERSQPTLRSLTGPPPGESLRKSLSTNHPRRAARDRDL